LEPDYQIYAGVDFSALPPGSKARFGLLSIENPSLLADTVAPLLSTSTTQSEAAATFQTHHWRIKPPTLPHRYRASSSPVMAAVYAVRNLTWYGSDLNCLSKIKVWPNVLRKYAGCGKRLSAHPSSEVSNWRLPIKMG
jgi:hypothetical protein